MLARYRDANGMNHSTKLVLLAECCLILLVPDKTANKQPYSFLNEAEI